MEKILSLESTKQGLGLAPEEIEQEDELSSFSMMFCAEECIRGKYVLVLGNEAIINKDLYNFGTIEDIILDRLTLEQKLVNIHKSVCCKIGELVKEGLFASQIVSQELKNLLKTECFRIVLTTAYDPALELYLKDFWEERGEKLIVKNIKDEGFQNIDLDRIDLGDNEFKTITPTLYYLFGKAEYPVIRNKEIKKFAITDNDKMEMVSEWLGTNAPRNLLNYISCRKILAVGCNFDDWLFRFFWYMLHRDVSRLGQGEVAIDFKEGENEKLNDYLVNVCETVMFKDLKKFLIDLKNAIDTKKDDIKEEIKKDSNRYFEGLSNKGVFLSYAHEDLWIVEPIYRRLRKSGINAWMDLTLAPGDDYSNRIIDALNQCKAFIPILSSTVKTLMSTKDNDGYMCDKRYFYNTEWKTIQTKIDDLKGEGNDPEKIIRIFPVIVGGYEKGENYSNKLMPFINSHQAIDISKDPIENLIFKLLDI